MISIIICSANTERLDQVKAGIAATIGVPYEVIAITDAAGTGICDAYNKGAGQALYNILCFVHDDVTFLTENWGRRVAAHFEKDGTLGLIGLAGSRYKSNVPSGWWTGMQDTDCCNIYQRLPDGSNSRVLLRPEGMTGDIIPVRTLDGVWLCMRKQVWQNYPFNSEQLKGFHFYDLDISLRVSASWKTGVVYDIDVVHFSLGGFNDEWVKAAIYFHRKVRPVQLPCSIDNILTRRREQQVNRSWLLRLRGEKISLGNKLLWCVRGGALGFISNWPHIGAFMFNIFLQRRS